MSNSQTDSYTRWTWRKLNLGLDIKTGQIVAAAVTTKEIGDGAYDRGGGPPAVAWHHPEAPAIVVVRFTTRAERDGQDNP